MLLLAFPDINQQNVAYDLFAILFALITPIFIWSRGVSLHGPSEGIFKNTFLHVHSTICSKLNILSCAGSPLASSSYLLLTSLQSLIIIKFNISALSIMKMESIVLWGGIYVRYLVKKYHFDQPILTPWPLKTSNVPLVFFYSFGAFYP